MAGQQYETPHRHQPPPHVRDADGHDREVRPHERGPLGAARCPVCARHDHRNTEPFGWTLVTVRGQKPNPVSGDYLEQTFRWAVPAYLFTCEACRGDCTDLAGIAAAVDVWTPAGARWRREHPELFPGQLPLIMDDDGARF